MPRKRVNFSKEYHAAFPSVLRRLMDETETSQQVLGTFLGKSRQAVAFYCDGSSSPDWETLVKIADYFNVSLDYLTGRTTAKNGKGGLRDACDYLRLSQDFAHGLKDLLADWPQERIDIVFCDDFIDVIGCLLSCVNASIMQGANEKLNDFEDQQPYTIAAREYCAHLRNEVEEWSYERLRSIEEMKNKERHCRLQYLAKHKKLVESKLFGNQVQQMFHAQEKMGELWRSESDGHYDFSMYYEIQMSNIHDMVFSGTVNKVQEFLRYHIEKAVTPIVDREMATFLSTFESGENDGKH